MYHISRVVEPLGSTLSVSTKLSSTSKALIACCISVAIFIVLGVYVYRRRHKYSFKNPGFLFNRCAFCRTKKSSSSSGLDKYTVTGLTKLNSGAALSPGRPRFYTEPSATSSSDDRTLLSRPSPLRNANADEDEKMSSPTLAIPKPATEKDKPSRSKPTWWSPITIEEERRLPPSAYAMSSTRQEMLIPVPSQRPPQKSRATPMPRTPPVTWKSHAFVRSTTSPKSLVIPNLDTISIISPARSKSFVSENSVLPSTAPASPTAALDSIGSYIGPTRVEHDIDGKLPRLTNVVALFTPNLPDELRIKVGDTVLVVEEYEDGWCFAQILGKKDAPKGVVPLVCLQARKRHASFKHKLSNSS